MYERRNSSIRIRRPVVVSQVAVARCCASRSPCLTAFRRERALPSTVRGPVDCSQGRFRSAAGPLRSGPYAWPNWRGSRRVASMLRAYQVMICANGAVVFGLTPAPNDDLHRAQFICTNEKRARGGRKYPPSAYRAVGTVGSDGVILLRSDRYPRGQIVPLGALCVWRNGTHPYPPPTDPAVYPSKPSACAASPI